MPQSEYFNFFELQKNSEVAVKKTTAIYIKKNRMSECTF